MSALLKKVNKEEIKTYVCLYLMASPFTYLVIELGEIDGVEWPFLNIFIALSLWLYIKKIQPLLNAEAGKNKVNIILFLLITTLTLLSIKSVANISRIESEVSSMESEVSGMETALSTLQSGVSNIEADLSIMTLR